MTAVSTLESHHYSLSTLLCVGFLHTHTFMPFAAGQMVALSSGSLKETFTAGKRESTRQRYEDESVLLIIPLEDAGSCFVKVLSGC